MPAISHQKQADRIPTAYPLATPFPFANDYLKEES